MIIKRVKDGEKENLNGCVVDPCIRITAFFTVFEEQFNENYYFCGETHDFWEFVCVLDGVLGVTAGKDIFLLEQGQALLHKPMEFHRLWSENQTKPHIIIFSFVADIMPYMKERRFTMKEEWLHILHGLIERRDSIFDVKEGLEIIKIKPGKSIQAHIFVSEFEDILLKSLEQKERWILPFTSQSAQNYRKIVRILDEHLDEQLTLSKLAELAQMSQSAIKKTFSKYTGIGVMAYFNQIKVQKAVSLLKAGKSVGEIAEQLGFSDQNYFSTVFKRVTGYSPLQYMKELR